MSRSGLIPEDWTTFERDVPVRLKKTKIAEAFDADMVKWFRGMGLGYQARMNAVLRTYMLAIISKEIERHGISLQMIETGPVLRHLEHAERLVPEKAGFGTGGRALW